MATALDYLNQRGANLMSKAPTNYLDVMNSKQITTPQFATKIEGGNYVFKDGTNGTKTMFTKYMPPVDNKTQEIAKKVTPQLNFGPGVSQQGVTNVNQYNPVTKKNESIFKEESKQPTKGIFDKIGEAIIPTTNAMSEDELLNGINQGTYDDTINQLSQEGYSIEEITQSLKDELVTTPVQDTQQEQGFMQSVNEFSEGTNNLIGGAIAKTPEIVSNIGGFILGKPVDFALKKIGLDAPSLEEQFKKDGIKGKEDLQKILGINPDSFMTKLGEGGAELGSLFIPVGGVGVGSKIASKYPQIVEGLTKLSEVAPKTFNTIKSALTGAKEMAKYDIVTEGEVKPEDVAIGAVTGPVIDILGTGIVKTKDYLTKEVPEKLISSGIMNRADFTNISKRLAKLTGKEPDPTDASKWLLNNIKKADDKSGIRTQIQEGIKKDQEFASNLLKGNTKPYDTAETQELKKALREKLQDYGTFTKNGDFIPDAGQSKISEEILSIINPNSLTLEQINKGRKILGDGLFTQQGSMKELARKEGWQNVWKDTSKFIEETVPGFRQANKNVEVGIAVNDAILKKETADLTKQILGGSALGGIYGGASSGGDPVEILKSTLAGALIGIGASKTKDLLTSTKTKSTIALALKSLGKEDKQILTNFAKTGEVTEGLNKVLKILVAQGLSPNN